MTLRSRLLTAVVVTCGAAAVAGFFLFMTEGPDAGRVRLLIDVMVMATLAGTVVVVTRPPLQRREELIDAMRALARGAKERRLDHERFGDLSDIARTYNELAAALTERNDPNLGPVKAKRRERPPWQGNNYSDHPELGEVRVMSRRAADPVVKEFDAEAKLRGPDSRPAREVTSAEEQIAPDRVAADEGERELEAPAEEPSSSDQAPHTEAQTAGSLDSAEIDEESGRPVKASPDNDTAVDQLLNVPAEGVDDEAPDESLAEEKAAAEEVVSETAVADDDEPGPPVDLRALFDEFIGAKRDLGEEVPELDFDAFASALDEEIERLRRDHRCRGVRFEVCVQNDEVSLQPRLLR